MFALLTVARCSERVPDRTSGDVPVASRCDGEGGERDMGDSDAAYCELANEPAGDTLVEDVDGAKGEPERSDCWCCEKFDGEMGE